MKKFLAVCVFCLAAVSAVMAEGLNYQFKDKFEASLLLGSAIRNEIVDFTFYNTDVSADKASFSGGVQLLYYFTNHLGLGMELMLHSLGQEKQESLRPSEIYYYINEDITKRVSLTQLFVAGTFVINPQNKVKFYMPFGGGFAFYRTTDEFRAWYHDYYLEEDITLYKRSSGDTYTKAAFYAGFGIEFPYSNSTSWSLESRYSVARLPEAITESETLKSIEVFLKFSFRA
ncbi:MAG: outer membrane beta-barrel protein [Endomicrobia bacterium]|nr:outer membrane beta-barrel protein [Endomicrobiia bacterium]MCL2506552.1 outer membrane beta-barrel protein [Endomicrobiia bacterium]MCL2506611.1 outer membrane beta-barrel protein [Endomicrobiia bacterium]